MTVCQREGCNESGRVRERGCGAYQREREGGVSECDIESRDREIKGERERESERENSER